MVADRWRIWEDCRGIKNCSKLHKSWVDGGRGRRRAPGDGAEEGAEAAEGAGRGGWRGTRVRDMRPDPRPPPPPPSSPLRRSEAQGPRALHGFRGWVGRVDPPPTCGVQNPKDPLDVGHCRLPRRRVCRSSPLVLRPMGDGRGRRGASANEWVRGDVHWVVVVVF